MHWSNFHKVSNSNKKWSQLKSFWFLSVCKYLFRVNKNDTLIMPKAIVLMSSLFTLNRYLYIGLLLTLNLFNRLLFFSANIYLFKFSNRNTRKKYEIRSKLIIKKPEWCQWHRSGVFIVNFELISHLFLLLILSRSIIAALWRNFSIYSFLVSNFIVILVNHKDILPNGLRDVNETEKRFI